MSLHSSFLQILTYLPFHCAGPWWLFQKAQSRHDSRAASVDVLLGMINPAWFP